MSEQATPTMDAPSPDAVETEAAAPAAEKAQPAEETKPAEVDTKRIRQILQENDSARLRTWLGICSSCGLCAESCFFYLANDKDPKLSPAYKTRATLGRLLKAKGKVSRQDLEEIKEVAWGQCTLCRRCAMFCPFGIDTATMINVARICCNSQGVLPEGLANATENILKFGNQMAMPDDEWEATVEWMAEEYEEEMPGLEIPMDKKGAKYFYVVNPREPMYYPQELGEAAMIFKVAGESWTVTSGKGWDGTNLAMFAADKQAAGYIAGNMYRRAQELGCEQVLVSECGHAYRSAGFEGPYFLGLPGGKTPVPVKHSVQLFWEYICRDGRIKIDPAKKLQEPVTIQDPCNISRNGGDARMLRELANALCDDFRDMNPNMEYNHCCGGGGGFMPMGPPYKERRMISGKIKADQIKATEAKVIIVPCHNCFDQITDLNKYYDLGMKVVSFKELIVHSMIVPPELQPAPSGDDDDEAGE